jgi:hypothetical protein
MRRFQRIRKDSSFPAEAATCISIQWFNDPSVKYKRSPSVNSRPILGWPSLVICRKFDAFGKAEFQRMEIMPRAIRHAAELVKTATRQRRPLGAERGTSLSIRGARAPETGASGPSGMAADRRSWTGHSRDEAIAFARYRLDEPRLRRVVAESQADFPNRRIDRILGIEMDTFAPQPFNNFLTCNEISRHGPPAVATTPGEFVPVSSP